MTEPNLFEATHSPVSLENLERSNESRRVGHLGIRHSTIIAVIEVDVFPILSEIEAGDAKASEELLPLVYEELRKISAALMPIERTDHTLQATGLDSVPDDFNVSILQHSQLEWLFPIARHFRDSMR
ncbi:ECF-type sigma factor [Novipirellula sp. SH528]|uniref:ECF-type sigma factor n=1 Tax=Novipirellula sp. SH528 TaxID=3454466 RepID=UPI003FA112F9